MTHRFRKEPLVRTLVGVVGVAMLPVGFSIAGPGGYTSSGGGGTPGIAERELVRRQNAISEANDAINQGDKLFAEKDYEGAIAEYRRALDLYPVAPVTQDVRDAATARYARASVELARQRAENGEYDNARGLLQNVLAPDVDPDNAEAKRLLEDLDDPEIHNPALTPEHVADVQEVEKLLDLAIGQYDLGQYDNARDTLNKVLAIDRYNTAARRKLEQIEHTVSEHHKSSRDHTRAQMLRMVDELWETSVPDVDLGTGDIIDGLTVDDGSQLTMQKLREIRIPNVSFEQATVQEAVDFLRLKSKELDVQETDPARKGVNIIIKEGSSGGMVDDGTGLGAVGTPAGSRRISLALSDVPLGEALKYVTDLAQLRYRVEPFAVVVVPATDPEGAEMYTRVFRVPPTFLTSAGSPDGGADAVSDPFADPGADGGASSLIQTKSAKEILSSAGVTFPEGASAYYDKATSRLIVRNTANNIDLVSNYVENLITSGQQQIYITTKFVEVTQKNLNELGFDWLIGPFNISGSDRVFGSGGTVGNSAAGELAGANWPFVPPGSDVPVGINPVTRGLRFGSNAITNDAIDDLLSVDSIGGGAVTSVSPGIFALSGIFTDPQFQVVIRALNQKKGVDLMSAPSIVTRSGQRAKIEVIREFIYPTEFDPPEIPQDFGSIGGVGGFGPGGFGQGSVSSFPVTPTTPTAFETRNTGVTLEVDPVIGPDGYTIDLNLAPEVVEFEGFINYGSPIQTAGTNALGMSTSVVLTENRIEQPVFSTRKVTTAVTIWDGQTVAIGGLIREDVQSVEDKVPVLGSIPWVGRLFQTKAENHFKRNLMIFVTAKLIDPAGQGIRDQNVTDLPPTTGEDIVPAPADTGFADSAFFPDK